MLKPRHQVRYVVLHHAGFGVTHFDLMIETEPGAERLLTWRTPVWPLVVGTKLTPLGEHRREYLDYEGPISGGRGIVQRIASGCCEISFEGDGAMHVRFSEGQHWRLTDYASLV
jgi:hypothetical protein